MATKRMTKAKHFYVYAVINFEQRLAYIGSRGSVKPPLEDPYMGSYDKKSGFKPKKKLILSEHQSRKDAFEAERKWQMQFDVASSKLFVNKGIHIASGFSSFGRKRPPEEMLGIIKARSKSITLKNYKTGEIARFSSYSEAAKAAGASPSNIVGLVKKRNTVAGSFTLPETTSEQVEKALQKKKIKLKHVETGEIIEFDSHREAADFIGVTPGAVGCLAKGKIKSTGMFVLPHRDAEFIGSVKTEKSLSLQNVKTGEIKEFLSYAEAARFLKCSGQSVSDLVKGSYLRLKGYCIPGTDLSRENRGGQNKKSIKIMDILTEEIYVFESQTAAAKFIGCRQSNISRMVAGELRRVHGYTMAPETDSTDSQ